ncbi:MAG: preprotein translocase subunit SecY [Oscillospiraceae bacterium]|nr:preprotein translocase subunit SecY [Oscillospiraceae bacterium]
MLNTLRNAWKIEELRRKLLFMLFIVLIYRLGNAVTVPFINSGLLEAYFVNQQNTILGMLNTMSGSALERASIFALAIQPYINASIIIQLLTVAIPALERLSKEGGEDGKKKLEKITRYTTIAIALLQAFGYYQLLRFGMGSDTVVDMTIAGSFWTPVVIVGTFMAGSVLVMWFGEQITEFGIGNGISIILFVSIVSRFPSSIGSLITNSIAAPSKSWIYALMLIGALAIMVLIVIVQESERRIPIQYTKQTRGRRMYGGQSTHLPIKVNMSGVLPIIFAQSIASVPATIVAFVPKWQNGWVSKHFGTTSWVYMVVYFLLIVFFSYFYSTIQMNPIEVSNNLKKNGGMIPGIRPGRPTSDFIRRVLGKVTLFGSLYLGVIAIGPLLVSHFSPTAASSGIQMGGTSIIIVISVALETIKQLEAQMLMRHYKGFLE